jgi:hypothetical protein
LGKVRKGPQALYAKQHEARGVSQIHAILKIQRSRQTLNLFEFQTTRGSGATPIGYPCLVHTNEFFEDSEEHIMASLKICTPHARGYSETTWFYSPRRWRFHTTKKINHEQLGGLTDQDPRVPKE